MELFGSNTTTHTNTTIQNPLYLLQKEASVLPKFVLLGN